MYVGGAGWDPGINPLLIGIGEQGPTKLQHQTYLGRDTIPDHLRNIDTVISLAVILESEFPRDSA